MRWIAVLALVAVACSGEQEPPTRQASIAAAPRKATIVDVAITPLDGDRVAIDIESTGWPGRALDPVLTIGNLRLTEYSFPRKHVIRYVLADRRLLPAGEPMYIQYGDDVSSRVNLEVAQ